MQHHRTLFSAALLALLLTSFVIAPTAFAGDVTFSGALDPASASFQRPSSPFTGVHHCSGLQTLSAYGYQAFPFYVSADGSYTLTVTAANLAGSSDTFMILYQGSFDPASPLTGCLAINDDGGGALGLKSQIPNYALTANTQYTMVISSFGQNKSGTFSGTISGPGDVMLGLYQPPAQDGAPTAPEVFRGFEPGDGRINLQAYAPAAVYCDAANSRVAIYGIDEAGSGYPALFVNEADLPPTPTEEQGHLLVAESGNIRLYRMTTGELQVRNGPDADGKEYAFIWDGCPATGGTAYTIENGIATRAE